MWREREGGRERWISVEHITYITVLGEGRGRVFPPSLSWEREGVGCFLHHCPGREKGLGVPSITVLGEGRGRVFPPSLSREREGVGCSLHHCPGREKGSGVPSITVLGERRGRVFPPSLSWEREGVGCSLHHCPGRGKGSGVPSTSVLGERRGRVFPPSLSWEREGVGCSLHYCHMCSCRQRGSCHSPPRWRIGVHGNHWPLNLHPTSGSGPSNSLKHHHLQSIIWLFSQTTPTRSGLTRNCCISIISVAVYYYSIIVALIWQHYPVIHIVARLL